MALDYLPSPGWAVVYGETPSADRWSELGENDDALATGAGIDDAAILNRHLSAAAVKAANIDFTTLPFWNFTAGEVSTNATWIDGKTIYKKTLTIGALPNATTKTITHGITYETVVRMYGIARSGPGSTTLNLPFVGDNVNNTASVSLVMRTNTLDIVSFNNRSSLSGYVTIEYTKP